MIRKIIQSGPATLSVSLPISWVKKFNIKKGQEINVEEQADSIKIKTTLQAEEESAKLNISELNPISTKIIAMLYRMGYKKIKAVYTPNHIVIHRGKEIKELDMVKNTFDHLIGMQLWEIGKDKNENYATVIESTKLNPKEFENVFNKLYFYLMNQSEQICEALSKNKDIFDEAFLAERLINQTQDFLIKILISFGYEEHKKTLNYYDFVLKLESIGDRYFDIAKNYHKNKEIINSETVKYMKKANDFIELSASLYRKFDFEKIISLTREINETINEYQEKLRKNKIKNSLVSHNIYSIFLELYQVAELIFSLNHKFFKEN
jgi:phosphate uptake regulator